MIPTILTLILLESIFFWVVMAINFSTWDWCHSLLRMAIPQEFMNQRRRSSTRSLGRDITNSSSRGPWYPNLYSTSYNSQGCAIQRTPNTFLHPPLIDDFPMIDIYIYIFIYIYNVPMEKKSQKKGLKYLKIDVHKKTSPNKKKTDLSSYAHYLNPRTSQGFLL